MQRNRNERPSPDLFAGIEKGEGKGSGGAYTARDIEVLEGLEPVRRRPGMYIGGTDERAMHHLVAEALDNAMDEAVAGHASRIEVGLARDGTVTVADNGRGIPVDPHPKFKKPAVEIILTTLHSGGKFTDKVYKTAGGLHGVGISVVNALSESLTVEVARERRLWVQSYSRGAAKTRLKDMGAVSNRRGTTIRFRPDPKIFGEAARFRPALVYGMARSKAYLFRGVEIRWACAPELLKGDAATPAEAVLHFPGGLADFLAETVGARACVVPVPFRGEARLNGDGGADGEVAWAATWVEDEEGFVNSYCNTVPTPQGGTHEAGFRSALAKGIRAYGELVGNRRAAQVTPDDAVGSACALLSLLLPNPQFQGQTKERLSSPEATRLVETTVRDHFDHWLSADPARANLLLDHAIARAEDRRRRREAKETERKSATRRLRLPGKLADCTRTGAQGTEVFLVEGDSAGGSAKQARNRDTQAVLPLRGKILNVAAASSDKLAGNQELKDLVEALGCGTRGAYDGARLRYERVIIMTDADVDGAHIASLLMTFFFREMPGLVTGGHLYLAQPPLYRLAQGGTTAYARDDAHREELLRILFKGKTTVEVTRFKGLGEMPPMQLKETTMDPRNRTLLRVEIPDGVGGEAVETARLVEALMGRNPEPRFRFIQEKAKFVEVDV
ncbi:MAG: DNA topoisomerase IV subunit B [Proteobacteria bacterium]|nr:DNA topoisomerase IV subunit B [Pseudomonadota bacterium]